MNVVSIVGRSSKDVELKSSSSGKSFAYITIAVDNYYNGEKQTQFIPCIAWGVTAENCAKYVKKGTLVAIEGSINYKSEKKDDNTFNTIFNVGISRIQFLSSSSGSFEKKNENNILPDSDETEASGEEKDAILWEY